MYDVIIGFIEDVFDFKGEELIIILDGFLYFVFYVVLLNYEELVVKYFVECFRVCFFFLLMSLKNIVDDEDYYSKIGVFFVGNLINLL